MWESLRSIRELQVELTASAMLFLRVFHSVKGVRLISVYAKRFAPTSQTFSQQKMGKRVVFWRQLGLTMLDDDAKNARKA